MSKSLPGLLKSHLGHIKSSGSHTCASLFSKPYLAESISCPGMSIFFVCWRARLWAGVVVVKSFFRLSLLGLAMTAALSAVFLTFHIEPGLAAKFAIPNNFAFPNESGFSATMSDAGEIDLSNPFFQALGGNGRACVSCHEPDQGWSISAAGVKARFAVSGGKHPIFRTNDGSNCNHDIDVSTVESRRKAYSLLLDRGLLRV